MGRKPRSKFAPRSRQAGTGEAPGTAREALFRAAQVTMTSELLAVVADEINQPLTAIIANGNACLRLLRRAGPGLDPVWDAVSDIVTDGRRAGAIIGGLRRRLLRDEPKPEPLDVMRVIRAVLALARADLRRHRIAVKRELPSRLPPVMGDERRLQQVVFHLVINAVEAMSMVTDEPRLMTVRSQLGEASDVLVSIEDSGAGIAPAALERVFDVFFTTKPDRLGVGLWISRSIIEDHGGRLWVTPASSRGAAFHFSLPTSGRPAQRLAAQT